MEFLSTLVCVVGATLLACIMLFLLAFILMPLAFLGDKILRRYLELMDDTWDSFQYRMRERKDKKAAMIKEAI